MGKRLLIPALAGIALLAAAVPAQATVTIGSNLATPHADNMPGCNVACTAANIILPAANRAPGGLTSPVNGTVTSWRVRANTGLNLQLRLLRLTGAGAFTGAGSSNPASFAGPGLSPDFPTSLPISLGDFIGLNSPNGNLVLGNNAGTLMSFWNVPPLADGATRVPTGGSGTREVLVQATVEPDNAISFGKLKRNEKKGIAKLTVELPNPGELTFSGRRVKVLDGAPTDSMSIGAPGEIRVKIKAKGKKRRNLNRNGKVKVKPIFTFTPTNGTTSVTPRKLKLVRKR